MKITKAVLNKGRRKLQKDLFYGRSSYRFLKESTNKMLQDTSRAWNNLPQPITKRGKETRETVVAIASLGSVLLARIREAEKYRRSIKFRQCRYQKYIDKNRLIFECSFFKLVENSQKVNYFVLSSTSKGETKAKLIKDKLNVNLPIKEKGRFRFSPIFVDEFNVFFYPERGVKYGYLFKGNSNNYLKASRIGL